MVRVSLSARCFRPRSTASGPRRNDWALQVFIHGMPVPSDGVPGAAVATFGVSAQASLGAASVIADGVAEKYPN